MRRNIVIVVLVAGLTYALTLYLDHGRRPDVKVAPQNYDVQVPEIDELPVFEFKALDGRTYNIDDFKGKVVLLNFWASWCPPCITEFPDLLNVAGRYKNDLVLVALSTDLSEEKMMRFLEQLQEQGHAIKQPNVYIALDEKGRITRGMFKTQRLPETLVINRDMKPVKKLVGANWNADQLDKIISGLKN